VSENKIDKPWGDFSLTALNITCLAALLNSFKYCSILTLFNCSSVNSDMMSETKKGTQREKANLDNLLNF
jgi:hypothetical protein